MSISGARTLVLRAGLEPKFVEATDDEPRQLYPSGASVYYGTDQRTLTTANGTLLAAGDVIANDVWLVSSGQATVNDHPAASLTQARRRAEIAAASARGVEHGTLPEFVRYSDDPIEQNTVQPSLGWWKVFPGDWLSAPVDNWYAMRSTDHSTGVGGIEVLTSPNWFGPFTSHGVKFVDPNGGSLAQTEQPTPFPKSNGTVGALYQAKASTSQNRQFVGLIESSADGLTWTRYGEVLAFTAVQIKSYPTEGDVGYSQIEVIGGTLCWRGVINDGTYSFLGEAFSNDEGHTWGFEEDMLVEPKLGTTDTQLKWAIGSTFVWYGQSKILCYLRPYGGGAIDPTDQSSIYVADWSPTHQSLASQPQVLLDGEDGPAWEDGNLGGGQVIRIGNQLVLYYISGGDVGVATAEMLNR